MRKVADVRNFLSPPPHGNNCFFGDTINFFFFFLSLFDSLKIQNGIKLLKIKKTNTKSIK